MKTRLFSYILFCLLFEKNHFQHCPVYRFNSHGISVTESFCFGHDLIYNLFILFSLWVPYSQISYKIV